VGHGNVNMETALEESCDVYFYNLGFIFNGRKGTSWRTGEPPGLRKKTGVDIPGEYPGLVLRQRGNAPTTRARSGTRWTASGTPATRSRWPLGRATSWQPPLQLATAYAASPTVAT